MAKIRKLKRRLFRWLGIEDKLNDSQLKDAAREHEIADEIASEKAETITTSKTIKPLSMTDLGRGFRRATKDPNDRDDKSTDKDTGKDLLLTKALQEAQMKEKIEVARERAEREKLVIITGGGADKDKGFDR